MKLKNKSFLIAASVISMLVVSHSTYAAQNLFNGSNLDGWQHVGGGRFVVENNLLKTEGGMGLLWYTKQKFGNAILRIVYKTSYKDSNSGIFVRIGHPPQNVWDAVHHAYEIQICDSGPDAYDDYHSTGAIYSYSKAMSNAANPPGQWNEYEITLKGEQISVRLNGKMVNKFDATQTVPDRRHSDEPIRGPRPVYGYIGIQNHDHNATHKDGHVYFKEISVKPLKS